jgi:hypothetical protein
VVVEAVALVAGVLCEDGGRVVDGVAVGVDAARELDTAVVLADVDVVLDTGT